MDNDLYESAYKAGYETAKKEFEPRQGKWREHKTIDGGILYVCTNCSNVFELTYGTPKDNNYNFCPSCGADMRGKEK